MRKEIILCSKLILVNNLFPNRLLLRLNNAKEELIVDTENSSFKFIGLSQLSQQAVFLFSYLFENQQVLVDLFLQILKWPNIGSIAFKLIPMIFGFFSSQENMEMAESFYMKILKQNAYGIHALFPVIIPFFRCAAVYRFIESSSSMFFQRFMSDISDPKRKVFNFLIPIHAGFLIDCFTNAICMLPLEHIKIMRELLKLATPQEFLDFILDEFFAPLTLAWLKAEALPSDTPFFENIVNEMKNRTIELQALFEAIKTTKTVFQPPHFINKHSDPMLLYSRVSDIIILVKLMNDFKLLPSYISLKDFDTVSQDMQTDWIWCSVFSKNMRVTRRVPQPLLFTDTKRIELPKIQNAKEITKQITSLIYDGSAQGENPYIYAFKHIRKQNKEQEEFVLKFLINSLLEQAENFESFIEEHVYLTELKNWRKTISEFLQKFVTRRLEFLYFSKKMNHSYIVALKSVYNNSRHKELFYLFALEAVIPKIIEFFGERITDLQNNWDKAIKDMATNSNNISFPSFIKTLRPILADGIWDSIKILRCTWKLPFFHRYLHIMRGLKVLDAVASQSQYGRKTMVFTLQQIKGNIVIPTFVIFNSLCIHSSIFPYYMEEDDRRLWVNFESSILQIVASDELISELIQIQDEIRDKFLEKVEGVFRKKH